MDLDRVVIEFIDNNETEQVHPTELRPTSAAKQEDVDKAEVETPKSDNDLQSPPEPQSKDTAEITDDAWTEAQEIYDTIKPLLENPDRTRADAEAVAAKRGVHVATVYEWMSTYAQTGQISSLVKRKRGRKRGSRWLTQKQEDIIDEILVDDFLDDQALTPAAVIEAINEKFEEAGIVPPHPNTIRNRIANIPLKRRLSTRGHSEEADQKTEARPGKFPHGNFPLECVQIDHVRLNMKCVDAETRLPIEKRPWLTLAIDCFSRMIVGFFLSFMSPSAFGVGVCLYMSIMRKDELLAVHGLPGSWPVYGKMRKVHFDNANEFKGNLVKRACEEYLIDVELRPEGTPHYGAYIEAMVGNVNKQLNKRRGTTHSSIKTSPDYDSSGKAIYTLADVEAEVLDWIVNSYHVSRHSEINTTPLALWKRGLLGDKKMPGVGLPQIPANHEKLRLDFLPFERRVVNPQGIEIGNRFYYHESLRTWVGSVDPDNPKKRRKFVVRYDPRTIRKVWFLDPQLDQYFEIPLRDTTWPDISWSEFDENRRLMLKEGYREVDEQAIKGYVQRRKLREAKALEATQAARKGKPKSAPPGSTNKPSNTAPGSNLYAQTGASASSPSSVPENYDDLFSQPAKPFEDIIF
jgi:putative transposase